MAKTSVRTRVLVPLLALVFAFAFAPAAFAAQLEAQDVAQLATQEEGTGDSASADDLEDFTWEAWGCQDLDKAQVTVAPCSYTGTEVEPAVTITVNGQRITPLTDYNDPRWEDADSSKYCSMWYDNNVNVGGNAEVYLLSWKGSDSLGPDETDPFIEKVVKFTIAQANLGTSKLAKISVPAQEYTGKKLKPQPTVTFNGMTLKKNTDYTIVKWAKNVKAGTNTGKVTIQGKGRFTGKLTGSFSIKKASMADAKIKLSKKTFTYTGKKIEPNVTVTLKGKKLSKKEYKLKFKQNKNAGIATVIVKGNKKDVKGSNQAYFTIKPAKLKPSWIWVGSRTWTGSPLVPDYSVKNGSKKLSDINNKDFSVSFTHNTEPGYGQAYFTGKGNYTGSVSKSFPIYKRSVNDASVWLLTPYRTLDIGGKTLVAPEIQRVSYNNRYLGYGADYQLLNNSNVDAYWNDAKNGVGTVTIQGIGDHYTGTKRITYYFTPTSSSTK